MEKEKIMDKLEENGIFNVLNEKNDHFTVPIS